MFEERNQKLTPSYPKWYLIKYTTDLTKITHWHVSDACLDDSH